MLGVLLVFAGLSSLASSANATPAYELRGEWSLELTCVCMFPTGSHTLSGSTVISKMEEVTGDFSGNASLLNGLLAGSLSGKATGSQVSVEMSFTTPQGPFTFTSTEGTI